MNTEKLISKEWILFLSFVPMYVVGLYYILSTPDKIWLFLHYTTPFVFFIFLVRDLIKTLSEEREYRKEEIDHKEEVISVYKKHIDNMRNLAEEERELIQSQKKQIKQIKPIDIINTEDLKNL